jgi:hypothetical protein
MTNILYIIEISNNFFYQRKGRNRDAKFAEAKDIFTVTTAQSLSSLPNNKKAAPKIHPSLCALCAFSAPFALRKYLDI